jgi:DNA-binding winged helix-turn-helix (wHTH) protein
LSELLNHPNRRENVLRYADVEFDTTRFKVRRDGRFVPLSTMQTRLLRHFLENPEVVFSRKDLLKAVWGNERVTDGAVTACVMRIRLGLNAAGGPELIRCIPGVGYALDADAQRPLQHAASPERVHSLTESSRGRNRSVTNGS